MTQQPRPDPVKIFHPDHIAIAPEFDTRFSGMNIVDTVMDRATGSDGRDWDWPAYKKLVREFGIAPADVKAAAAVVGRSIELIEMSGGTMSMEEGLEAAGYDQLSSDAWLACATLIGQMTIAIMLDGAATLSRRERFRTMQESAVKMQKKIDKQIGKQFGG